MSDNWNISFLEHLISASLIHGGINTIIKHLILVPTVNLYIEELMLEAPDYWINHSSPIRIIAMFLKAFILVYI